MRADHHPDFQLIPLKTYHFNNSDDHLKIFYIEHKKMSLPSPRQKLYYNEPCHIESLSNLSCSSSPKELVSDSIRSDIDRKSTSVLEDNVNL